MNWNLEGLYVSGIYLEEFEVVGRVVNSRVAYGGTIKHTIELLGAFPENRYGIESDRSRLILDHKAITSVQSHEKHAC
jgi:hypothetical protein